ncbi:MAG TPA: hypothetical protein VEW72_08010 [Burkholderiales bacterium]|nr:hypothetical protein [Burkholderiales bacterium]
MKRHLLIFLALCCGVASAQDTTIVRLRGEVQSYEAPKLVIKERSGKLITMTLPEGLPIAEVIPTDITTIQPGSFIGTAAVPRPDGQLHALEVVVFPEAARGSGEGHYPWDLKPDSTMTNATVADLARSPQGRTLTLRYKEGEKKVIVPDGVPVVTFRPGNPGLIVPGAKVFIVCELTDDNYSPRRFIIGRNGLQPPM